MSATAFIIDKNNELTALKSTAYDSEDLFQRLLAEHPELLGLAGGDGGVPLLVQRELGVPKADDGIDWWSIDHLFIDRQGVPVLVEVKRATDTRARREVVAQMLDYAANGVAYWSIEKIVAAFEMMATDGGDPDDRLREFLQDPAADTEAFWKQVEANLAAGRVRMVFVADRIPAELRRIVEFLNEQMRPAEVLAIEVEQFTTDSGLRMLAPRLIGATERAKSAKAVQPARAVISEQDWLASLAEQKGAAAVASARKALDWFRARDFVVGITDSQDAMSARLTRPDGKPTWPFFIRRSTGKLEASLQYLKDNPAFANEGVRLGLLNRFKQLPGVTIATSKSTGWPAIPLDALSKSEVWDGFVSIAEEVLSRNVAGEPATED